MILTNEHRKIVFYDGDCGFCNRSVQFVLDHDEDQDVCFATLQSDFAREFLSSKGVKTVDLSTFYYYDGQRVFQKSTGALRVLNEFSWKWKWLKLGYVLPRFLRDAMYNFIARRRHRLAPTACALPTLEQRKRFIND